MPNDFDRKQEIFWNIFSIVVAVILIAGMLCLSVLGIKVSLEQLDRKCVAYADSTDGVVEDNLLLNSDFANFDNLISNNQNAMTIYSYSPIRFSSSSNWGYIAERHSLNFYDFTQTITFTVRIRSVGGNQVVVGARCWNSAGNSVRSFSTQSTTSQSFVNLSVSYNSLDLSGAVTFGFCYYCNSATSTNNICEIEWAKVEYGSSFTGYVQKDYTNYGYNQGYSVGYEEASSQIAMSYGFNSIDNLSYVQLTRYDRGSYNVSGNDGVFILDGKPYGYLNQGYYMVQEDPYPIQYSLYLGSGSQVSGLWPNAGFKYTSRYNIQGDFALNIPWVDVPSSLSAEMQPIKIALQGRDTGRVVYISQNDTQYWHKAGYLYDITLNNSTYQVYFVSIFYHFDEPVDIYFIPETYISSSTHFSYICFPDLENRFGVYYNSWAPVGATKEQADSFYYQGYNDGYTKGQAGLSDATEQAYNEGKDAGVNIGQAAGYSLGYAAGSQSASTYTFKSLITSVIDVPVYTIFGLLDFDLLGVNMKSFFFSIFTIMIVFVIVRIVLGGI